MTITASSAWTPSAHFLDRIKHGYRLALAGFQPETSAIWSGIRTRQNDIHQALLGDGDLGDLLRNPAKTSLYYGVDNLCSDHAGIPSEPMAAHVADQIQLLGTSLGLCRLPNPTIAAAPLPSATEIVERLPPELDFPNPFAGEAGFQTTRGVASFRAVQAIYQAMRLHDIGNGNGRCLEIGAGMGRTAYYACRLGLTDYTIVDLPLALVGQAAFLAGALGEDAVSLPGERGNGIQLRSPQWLQSSDEHFDIAINVDSLTEMSLDYAKGYLEFIRNHCRAFLSINHEANEFTVREIATGMRMSRHLYPLRQGYLEEFITLARS